MDSAIRQARRAQWIEVIRACQARPKGQTVESWLEENGINRKTYYNRLSRLRQEALAEMKQQTGTAAAALTFAEIPASVTTEPAADNTPGEISGFHTDAVLCLGGATVAVNNGTSSELLSRIVEVLKYAR